MIRSARIPDVLSRIITKDPVIQTVLLVTADGELLGSTSSTFTPAFPTSNIDNNPVSGNGYNNTLSIEHLGALIADIAVDYQQLGDVMSASIPNSSSNNNPIGSNINNSVNAQNRSAGSNSSSNNNATNAAGSGSNTNKANKKSTTLLLELEQGLVGVSSCLDCWIIAIAATPNAPLGMIQARLQAITEYVQEGLSPLTETVMDR